MHNMIIEEERDVDVYDQGWEIQGELVTPNPGPASLMQYGVECWPTERQHIQQMNVIDMRILRWMCGHTRKDRIRNEVI
jgi:hypothetical protein